MNDDVLWPAPAFTTRADALAAADDDLDRRLDAALQRLLRHGSNANPALADGLRLRRRWYLGPLLLPLADIPRSSGPEDGMPYPEAPEVWNQRVDVMVAAIRAGWQPPPLLVEVGSHLMDGNHRHAALLRAGIDRYAAVLMFSDSHSRSAWALSGLPVIGTRAPALPPPEAPDEPGTRMVTTTARTVPS